MRYTIKRLVAPHLALQSPLYVISTVIAYLDLFHCFIEFTLNKYFNFVDHNSDPYYMISAVDNDTVWMYILLDLLEIQYARGYTQSNCTLE